MLTRWRRIMGYRPGKKLLAILAVLAAAALLLPLLRVALYSAPWYDDYLYGYFTKSALEEEGTLRNLLIGLWFCIRTQWYCWQGTFSSMALMCMIPMVWGEQYYFLGPVILLFLLVLSVYLLMGVLLRDLLKAEKWSAVPIQITVTVMAFELIYNLNCGIYWYNAGIHYIGMHAFMLLLLAGWIKLIRCNGRVTGGLLLIWSVLGAVLASGSNFVTALQGFLVGGSILVLGALLKDRRVLLLLPSLGVYCVGMYFNLAAPGNQVRRLQHTACGLGMDPMPAILRSFQEAVRFAWTFSGWITLLFLVLLIPLIWVLLRDVKLRFRFPGLFLAWSFCLYATGFTPSLYGMGSPGLGRTLNAVKLTFQILLVLNEIYFCGWLKEKLARKERKLDQGAAWWFYPVLGGLMLLAFTLEPNQSANYSTFAAYYYVHTGEAYNFHQEYLQRVQKIKEGGDDVTVEPYYFKPWILMGSELSDDPASEENMAIAKWYHKASVTCKKSQE